MSEKRVTEEGIGEDESRGEASEAKGIREIENHGDTNEEDEIQKDEGSGVSETETELPAFDQDKFSWKSGIQDLEPLDTNREDI
jgi:hypothetical protein